MIRPVQFRMNEQTAVNNYYQDQDADISNKRANDKAQDEFDAFAKALQQAGVNVIVLSDDEKADTPDSIFPNNWVSFHEDGRVALYPMFAENRRKERRPEVFDQLETRGFQIQEIIDYSSAEDEQLFLEGTGSLVLDRVNKKAYCALSPRADLALLDEFCEDFEYMPVAFTANQTVAGERLPIYHTNVMMSMGKNHCVICLDSIDSKAEKKQVVASLKEDGKEIIKISEAQVEQFAGNMLVVQGSDNEEIVVMSQAAYDSLREEQVAALEKHCKILSADISTIEQLGGGSVRCMLAEVFLPVR